MILYGTGGHAKVIVEAIHATGRKVTLLFDDKVNSEEIFKTPVVTGYTADLYPEDHLIIAIGDNHTREKLANKVQHPFGQVFHPSAYISPSAKINEGTVILVNATINTDSEIGKHCIVNTGAIVDHDVLLNDFVHVAPNATLCGHVEVGKSSLIGAGSVITPSVKIGSNVIIGAGRTVTKDVPDNTTVTIDWV